MIQTVCVFCQNPYFAGLRTRARARLSSHIVTCMFCRTGCDILHLTPNGKPLHPTDPCATYEISQPAHAFTKRSAANQRACFGLGITTKEWKLAPLRSPPRTLHGGACATAGVGTICYLSYT